METSPPLDILKAMADESRLSILASLLAGPRYVEELAQRLNLAASTVSHHLKKLEQAGLVSRRKEQYYVVYRARDEVLAQPLRHLVEQAASPVDAEQQRLQRYHRKVLDTFFEDGRLRQIPSQYKKRLVILAAMARDFDLDRDYPENEVNAIIMRRHEDYCLIRREMVMAGLMERAEGIYRRIRNENDGSLPALPMPGESTPDQPSERQQLKQAYQHSHKTAGLYCVRNLKTGKILLGSSLNLEGPLNRHRAELRFGTHRCKLLQDDWNELGEESFAFEVVDTVPPGIAPGPYRNTALKTLERRWLEKLRPLDENTYNTSERIRTRPY
jgi:biotin operon repressor